MSHTKTFSSLFLSMSVLALAACGGEPTRSVDSHKTSAPLPPVASGEQTIPVSDTLSVVDTVAPPVTNTTAAAGSMEERMAKLENAVGSLRTDYDRIMPAFASLNSTNERIQTLLDQIEHETGKTAAVAPVVEVPVKTVTTTTTKTTVPPVMEPEKGLKIQETKVTEEVKVSRAVDAQERVTPVAQAIVKATPIDAKVNPDGSPVVKKTTTVTTTTSLTPEEATKMAIAQTGGQSVASNVRIGEHPGKTRLVLDLSKDTKPDFKNEIDNGEKLMTVALPGVTWGGPTSGAPKSSAFISNWSANKTDAGGSTLAVQLKKDAKILSTQYLKPEKGDPARLVIDIGPAT